MSESQYRPSTPEYRTASAYKKAADGRRVCAGLMTQITEDQKYGMIEAISHLIHRDYEAIVEDFVLLDFIPRGVSPRNQGFAAA
jgi:hypothetical protein